jgi:hypothetical protein
MDRIDKKPIIDSELSLKLKAKNIVGSVHLFGDYSVSSLYCIFGFRINSSEALSDSLMADHKFTHIDKTSVV